MECKAKMTEGSGSMSSGMMMARAEQAAAKAAERAQGGTHAPGRAVPYVCGLNHVRTPLDLRELYALSPEQARALTVCLNDPVRGTQAMVLSTCNRTEIYACSAEAGFGEELRRIFLAIGEEGTHGAGPAPLYEYDGMEAVRHLFAVGAGLDSMILGENQIKQQLREAWEATQSVAEQRGAGLGDLRRLVEAAFASGKRIRTETELNVGTLDVGKAAVMKGEAVLGSLAGRVCMVIGAGKVGRIAARALSERQPARLLIVNRTRERAEAIAREVGGEAYAIADLPHVLGEADFILGAAYAPELILNWELYKGICDEAQRPERVCMVDTAVPRIFDSALSRLAWVELFDIEEMQEIVATNRKRRMGAARDAWQIVEAEVEKYRAGLQHAELGPVIAALREEFERIFEEEAGGAQGAGGSEEDAAGRRRLKQRLLHAAIVRIKQAAGG